MKRIFVLFLTIFLLGNIAIAHGGHHKPKKLSCPQVIKRCSVITDVENDFSLCKSCCTSNSKDSKCIKRCFKKCPDVSTSSSSGGNTSNTSGGSDNVTSNDG